MTPYILDLFAFGYDAIPSLSALIESDVQESESRAGYTPWAEGLGWGEG